MQWLSKKDSGGYSGLQKISECAQNQLGALLELAKDSSDIQDAISKVDNLPVRSSGSTNSIHDKLQTSRPLVQESSVQKVNVNQKVNQNEVSEKEGSKSRVKEVNLTGLLIKERERLSHGNKQSTVTNEPALVQTIGPNINKK